MRAYFWIFVIFVVQRKIVLAKLYGRQNIIESNSHSIDRQITRQVFYYKLIDLVQDCMQELGLRNEPIEVRRKQLVCILECVGKKISLIDNLGNLNEHEYRNYVDDLPLDENQRAKADGVLNKCIDNIQMLPHKIDRATGCNRITTDAIVCLEKSFKTLDPQSTRQN